MYCAQDLHSAMKMDQRSQNTWQFVTLLTYVIVALTSTVPAVSKFVVEKNNLHVTSPDHLKGDYDSSIGNFGVPQYGGVLGGTVLYPDVASTGCKPFDLFNISFKPTTGGGMPPIVLVDRGDCYFAFKVWNAQNGGAAAVLVADDRDEPLLTMNSPQDSSSSSDYVQNITIPSALIQKKLGDALKSALSSDDMVNINLDWRESLPHPDDRVEYEFWTNSNDECGPKCDKQMRFVKIFKGAAQLLEKGGFTLFTPHYITWYCPQAFIQTSQCKSQCINNGRYCAPDPEQDFTKGYDGKDVVLENLRQLCVFKVATDLHKPWVWWDYVTDFQIRCPMKEQKYNQNCAEEVINSLGLSVDKTRECMGDPEADAENPILKAEQDSQVGHGPRGDVTMLPTLIINERQYRGKLDKGAVLKAICSGFKETTEPPVCLSDAIETNECLTNNGGCWEDRMANATACKDTFRGRVCECPLVQGIQFLGDGYNNCTAYGAGRCSLNNGGCWQQIQNGSTFSACLRSKISGCQCPSGFKGDGFQLCEDIDECKEGLVCQCPECTCKNTLGSYDCLCQKGHLYIREHDTCISEKSSASKVGWVVALIVLAGLSVAAVSGYIIYKYRLRTYMDSEIRAIMAQYMPLDSQTQMNQYLHEDI